MIRFRRQISVGLVMAAIALICWCLPVVEAAEEEGANAKQRFAINFNEAMNRCLQTGCKNIEELVGFFADESTYIDDSGQLWSGKTSIRKQFLRVQPVAGLSDRIEGIDVAGSVITLRLERRRTFKTGRFDAAEIKPHVQVILLKGSRIVRLISVISPDEK